MTVHSLSELAGNRSLVRALGGVSRSMTFAHESRACVLSETRDCKSFLDPNQVGLVPESNWCFELKLYQGKVDLLLHIS